MEKQQVVYIHGGEAFSDYNAFLKELQTKPIRNLPGVEQLKKWPSTLVDRLGEEYEVFQPSMPNSDNAKYQEWKIWFERHFEHLHDGVVLVGWSQGGYFLAKYLSENVLPIAIRAVFFLAAPYEAADFGREDGGDFTFDPALLPNIAKQTDLITFMHSTDDFVVPYEHALKYKEALPEAELVTFIDKNHFLVEELPELVERIKLLD